MRKDIIVELDESVVENMFAEADRLRLIAKELMRIRSTLTQRFSTPPVRVRSMNVVATAERHFSEMATS